MPNKLLVERNIRSLSCINRNTYKNILNFPCKHHPDFPYHNSIGDENYDAIVCTTFYTLYEILIIFNFHSLILKHVNINKRRYTFIKIVY
jgi:hypothetical protein